MNGLGRFICVMVQLVSWIFNNIGQYIRYLGTLFQNILFSFREYLPEHYIDYIFQQNVRADSQGLSFSLIKPSLLYTSTSFCFEVGTW